VHEGPDLGLHFGEA
jgi:hypothetical protein